jgi:hypothetical protein
MEVAFKFLIHEYYSRDLSQKIKSAVHEKMRRGESVKKNCLFGYKLNEKRQMIIDEPAAETVRLIFNFARNHSISETAQHLYDNKIPTPSEYKKQSKNHISCIWTVNHVRFILAEEQYTGVYIAGRTAKKAFGSKSIIRKPESEWYKIPSHHPAVIEQSLFETVRENFKRKKSSDNPQKRRNTDENLLKGRVICGCCGHKMQLTMTKHAKYQCEFTLTAADAQCHRLSIYAKDLTDMLFDIISRQARIILNCGDINAVGETDFKSEQQSEYEKKIAHVQSEKRELYEQFVSKEISGGDYKNKKSELDEEFSRLTGIYSALTAETARMSAEKKKSGILTQSAENILCANNLTRSLADSLIEKVYVYPANHITVEWKISDFCSMGGEK